MSLVREPGEILDDVLALLEEIRVPAEDLAPLPRFRHNCETEASCLWCATIGLAITSRETGQLLQRIHAEEWERLHESPETRAQRAYADGWDRIFRGRR